MLRLLRNESGATAIEYSIIAAATALAIITALPMITSSIIATFTSIGASL